MLVSGASIGAVPADLRAAALRYDAAQVHADKAALERLLAHDYLLVNSAGEVENKRQFIADLTDPAYKLNPYTVLQPIVRYWPGGAVMGGVAQLSGLSGGKSFSVCLRFADVWRRDKGEWHVAYTQAARAKPEDCAPS